jgi:RNA polymerase sigma-70 factor (ECF subfamily)
MPSVVADAEDWLAVVHALQAGERSAFRELARLITRLLCHYRAYDFRDEWDDVIQEVVLAAARTVAEGRLRRSHEVLGYIRNATRNCFVDWMRRRKLDSLDEAAQAAGGELSWPAAAEGEPARALSVRDELAKLPEKQRLSVVAVYVEGRTYEEAAEATGIPLGSLKRYLREGLATLQARLGEP